MGTQHETVFNQYFNDEGLKVIGYRDVPVDTQALAEHVASTINKAV
jgi:glutamate synthase (NADPH/NADH) large chain